MGRRGNRARVDGKWGGESMIHFLNHLTFSPSRLYCLDIPVASNFIINSCVIFIYKFSRTNEERMRVSSTYKTKITQRVNFNSKCSHLFFYLRERVSWAGGRPCPS